LLDGSKVGNDRCLLHYSSQCRKTREQIGWIKTQIPSSRSSADSWLDGL
jgi:hypothetical protein